MILSFSVENFRSILDRQELSFLASRHSSFAEALGQHTGVRNGILPMIAILGSNASGKTTVLRALEFFALAIESSYNTWKPHEDVPVEPHFFNSSAPTLMESEFICEDQLYRYGFSLNKRAVICEWLHEGRKLIFRRENGKYKFGESSKGLRAIVDLTRSNALFLSTAAQSNNEKCKSLQDKFSDWKFSMSDPGVLQAYTAKLMEKKFARSFFQKALSTLDAQIVGIANTEKEATLPFDIPDQFSSLLTNMFKFSNIVVTHRNSETNETATLPLREESRGTQRYLSMLGIILAVLQGGDFLVVDEIDSSLHPSLLKAVVALFQSPATNPLHAQVVFSTHDTALLDANVLRPDQVWFTERARNQGTKLYSLSDFEGIRSEIRAQRDYLEGRFGAVPFIEDHLQVFAKELARKIAAVDEETSQEKDFEPV